MKFANYLTWFYTLNKSIRFFILLFMIVLIAYMKHFTPSEFSIRLFYLIPLFLSVWDGKGIISGLYFSIICTGVYFYTESIQGNIHWHGIYLIWEFSIVCFYFITFVVIVDKLKNSNLFLNLISNAVKFTNRNGIVTIRAKKTEDQMVEISIKDSAIGMPKSLV